jgi:hypothetical protein
LSYKNVEATIGVINLQLPKYAIGALPHLWIWAKRLVDELREPLDAPKNLTLRVSQIRE